MRAFLALLMAVSAGVHAQTPNYIPGIFVASRQGPVELIAYAERAAAGRLSLVSGSLEDVPVLPDFHRALCNMPLWKPVGFLVASDTIFRDGRAESRWLTFVGRSLNIYAVELRVSDLERRDRVAKLFRSVKASGDNPAYVFVVVTSSGMTRYYPVRLAIE